VSAATSSPAGAAGEGTPSPPAQPPAPSEVCPLCGAPLHPEQEWCLSCGAAARTRLAASPNWRAPLITVVVVAVLSLGVLAGALVKLAGGSGSQTPATTTTVTTAAGALAPTDTTDTTPTVATQTTPGAATSTQSTTPSTPATKTNGVSTAPAITVPGTKLTVPTSRPGGAKQTPNQQGQFPSK
jgi:hypothetical protein